MKEPTVRTQGASCLSAVSQEVSSEEDAGYIDELLASMWAILQKEDALGLAANQIGVMKRVIVLSVADFTTEIINPVIIRRYGGRKATLEGCLSFPGQEVKITRYKRIVVEGFDRNWNPIQRKLSGLAAICVQHEVDHLNGKTIL